MILNVEQTDQISLNLCSRYNINVDLVREGNWEAVRWFQYFIHYQPEWQSQNKRDIGTFRLCALLKIIPE